MAMATRREGGLLDPDVLAGESPFGHHVYVIAGTLTPLVGDDRVALSNNLHEIDGTLQVTVATCQAESASVTAAFQAVSDLKSQIAELQSELSQAPHSERAFLIQQIHEIENNLASANAALDDAKQTLAACQARNATA
jgi:chromosome segregation ATPase